MKVLYGFYRPDEGAIWLDERPLDLRSPLDAVRAGIGMVFQAFMLIPAFSVVENIALFLPKLGLFLGTAQIRDRLEEFGSRYGLVADPDAKVWQLSVGEQQRVEILRLLVSGARILIFDEPTSVLAPHEVRGLFEILETLRRDGYTVLFITHKLKEAMTVEANDRGYGARRLRRLLFPRVPGGGYQDDQGARRHFGWVSTSERLVKALEGLE